jgi:hypothetical protein
MQYFRAGKGPDHGYWSARRFGGRSGDKRNPCLKQSFFRAVIVVKMAIIDTYCNATDIKGHLETSGA